MVLDIKSAPQKVKTSKKNSMKVQSLADLKRIAIAKHGENRAWSLAMLNGNPNHKKSWQEAILQPTLSLVEQLEHEVWQEGIKQKLEGNHDT